MNKLFWGLFFLLLDFTVTFNTSSVSLLPDFVGFILIVGGLDELSPYSYHFSQVRPHSVGMAVYTGLIFLGNLFGLAQHPFLSVILGLVAVGVNLYIQYRIVCGILDIEANPGNFLNGAVLYQVWKFAAVAMVITLLVVFIPFINLIMILVSAIASIMFLYQFYQSKKLFENIPPPTHYSVD